MNEIVQEYWRGVECRCEAVTDCLNEIREYLAKPSLTAQMKKTIGHKLDHIDGCNSMNYREGEELTASVADDKSVRADLSEVLDLIPAPNRLSQGDVIALIEHVKQWRVEMGLPPEVYHRG